MIIIQDLINEYSRNAYTTFWIMNFRHRIKLALDHKKFPDNLFQFTIATADRCRLVEYSTQNGVTTFRFKNIQTNENIVCSVYTFHNDISHIYLNGKECINACNYENSKELDHNTWKQFVKECEIRSAIYKRALNRLFPNTGESDDIT